MGDEGEMDGDGDGRVGASTGPDRESEKGVEVGEEKVIFSVEIPVPLYSCSCIQYTTKTVTQQQI